MSFQDFKKIVPLTIGVIAIGTAIFFWFTNKPQETVTPDKKVYKVGILARGRGSYEIAIGGFKERLKESGYVEGDNITYDVRYLTTKEELNAAANEFVNGNVDLINTYSTPATQAAYQATQNTHKPIPIVFASIGDPVAAGVVKGVQQSGTNVTGVISLATELTAKRLELLKRIDPSIKRIAMPRTAEDVNDVAANRSVEIASSASVELGLEMVFFPIRVTADNASTSLAITKQHIDGIIVGGDSLVWNGLDEYIKQAKSEKLPLGVFDIDQVKRGGLIGFGPDYVTSGQQAGAIANQIFQGKLPTDIPIETPRKLLLSLNLDTARAINITFDESLLKEADVIIGQPQP